jgi:tripartite-type tricarboxylate transporter receptor subunit TctC
VAGYETSSWLGLAGPPGLPADIAARLHKDTTALLADPAVGTRLRELGNVPSPTTPAAFKERVAADVAKWTKVLADAGIGRTRVQ